MGRDGVVCDFVFFGYLRAQCSCFAYGVLLGGGYGGFCRAIGS